MYDKCNFCWDQLPKLKKEPTASFFVNFGRNRGTKEPTYITVQALYNNVTRWIPFSFPFPFSAHWWMSFKVIKRNDTHLTKKFRFSYIYKYIWHSRQFWHLSSRTGPKIDTHFICGHGGWKLQNTFSDSWGSFRLSSEVFDSLNLTIKISWECEVLELSVYMLENNTCGR